MKKYTSTKERLGLYRKIEVGRKQLPEMNNDEVFRPWLQENFNKSSRTELSVPELARVLDLFASLGATFTSAKAAPKKRTNTQQTPKARPDWIEIPDNVPYAKMKREIAAIWRLLGYSLTSLETRVKREFKVVSFAWVHDEEQLKRLLNDLQRRERAFLAKQAIREGSA